MKRLHLVLIAALATLLSSAETRQEPVAEKPLFRFGLLADVQYADKDTSGARRYRGALAHLAACVEDLRDDRLDFVVQLGDLIDGRPDSEGTAADLEAVLALFARLEAPVRHVVGNHCLEVGRAALLKRLGLERGWYSFRRDGWRFVVIDSLEVSVCGRSEREVQYRKAEEWLAEHPAAEHKHAQRWNGGLGALQLRWLEDELSAAAHVGDKVVLFSHLPVLAAASSEWHLLWEHETVRKLLTDNEHVVAFVNGHDHGGGYALDEGVHHLTLEGMVEAPEDSNAYAVVEGFADRLELHGRGKVVDRTLRKR